MRSITTTARISRYCLFSCSRGFNLSWRSAVRITRSSLQRCRERTLSSIVPRVRLIKKDVTRLRLLGISLRISLPPSRLRFPTAREISERAIASISRQTNQ